jgi:hypothetical protein
MHASVDTRATLNLLFGLDKGVCQNPHEAVSKHRLLSRQAYTSNSNLATVKTDIIFGAQKVNES